jgi:hypothetical protein
LTPVVATRTQPIARGLEAINAILSSGGVRGFDPH